METKFTCYTKKVQGEILYFVKKFTLFPEYETLPPLLESYGMHADFNKACSFAQLFDEAVKKQLLDEMENGGKKEQAKIIGLKDAGYSGQRPAIGL